MADVFSSQQRSACMRAVRAVNTGPEMRVRRLAHAMGFRYALHAKNLPGKPDIVFVSRRKIIFVHGCFWHKHTCPHGRISPTTNVDYWDRKRKGNVERDRRNIRDLRKAGWRILVVWECWTRRPETLGKRLETFLQSGYPPLKRNIARQAGFNGRKG